jgi:hypothetical protein
MCRILSLSNKKSASTVSSSAAVEDEKETGDSGDDDFESSTAVPACGFVNETAAAAG